MSLVRRVITIIMSHPQLFQLPVSRGIFAHYKGKVLQENLRGRTEKVFSHLNIEFRSYLYEVQDPNGMHQSFGESTVVAVQQAAKMPVVHRELPGVSRKVHRISGFSL